MFNFFKKLTEKKDKSADIKAVEGDLEQIYCNDVLDQTNEMCDAVEVEPVESTSEPADELTQDIMEEIDRQIEIEEKNLEPEPQVPYREASQYEIEKEIDKQIEIEEKIQKESEYKPGKEYFKDDEFVNQVQSAVEAELDKPEPVETPQETQPAVVEQPKTEEKIEKGFWGMAFDNFRKTISKTTETLVDNVVHAIEHEEEFNEFILEDMEDMLIKADIGVYTAAGIVDKIRNKKDMKPSEVRAYLKSEFKKIIDETGTSKLNFKENELNIYFVTGVNGAGKTTFIGKLANRFRLEGKKVVIAAADTFRAAAEEQLDIWAQRAQVDIVRRDGADAASVVFDAIKKAQDENYDVLIIDTAGRLQNKFNLMEELKKIKSVIEKFGAENLRESILVLDANTGQNGLQQARVFFETVDLTSVALTKLDGSAKGGIIIAIAKDLKLPIKMIGVGEKITDLKDFDAQIFIDALFHK